MFTRLIGGAKCGFQCVYASEPLLEEILEEGDLPLDQASNVATLPGIEKFSLLLLDGHQDYGFPIGSVAAVDLDDGVISLVGIGFDLNCGVQVLRTGLSYENVERCKEEFSDFLYRLIPVGSVRASISTSIMRRSRAGWSGCSKTGTLRRRISITARRTGVSRSTRTRCRRRRRNAV
jgi:RNA-splicing ligase RtcB